MIKLKKLLKDLSILIIWLVIWSLASFFIGHEVLLPSPLSVVKALAALVQTSEYYKSAGYSLMRILCGFILGVLSGVIIAVITNLSDWLRRFFSPVLTIIKATPVASFIILLLVWTSRDYVPIFTSILIVMPIVCSGFLTGIEQTDPALIEMADAFKLSRKNKIKKLYIPSVMPYFSSASATSLGMAWKAGTAAEVICNPHYGIGARLYESKIYLEVPELFAWTITVIALSFILEKLLELAVKRMNKRRHTDD